MIKISLEGMEFYAKHGYYPEENRIGGSYLVDLSFEILSEKALQNDELGDTINYEEVYQLVKKEMDIPSKLIEHVAQRIINTLFKSFGAIQSVSIILKKINPPLGGPVQSVNVELFKSRTP